MDPLSRARVPGLAADSQSASNILSTPLGLLRGEHNRHSVDMIVVAGLVPGGTLPTIIVVPSVAEVRGGGRPLVRPDMCGQGSELDEKYRSNFGGASVLRVPTWPGRRITSKFEVLAGRLRPCSTKSMP